MSSSLLVIVEEEQRKYGLLVMAVTLAKNVVCHLDISNERKDSRKTMQFLADLVAAGFHLLHCFECFYQKTSNRYCRICCHFVV